MGQENAAMPSNKKFGYFFSVVFAIAGTYFFIYSSQIWVWIFTALTLVTFTVSLIAADRLAFFNRLWFKLGLLLNKIISPIVLGLIFFVLISPIAIAIRLFGRDELRLKMTKRASHWKERSPAGPEPQSFRNQY